MGLRSFWTSIFSWLPLSSLVTTAFNSHKGMDDFPDTLAGFGYAFNEHGQLRKINPQTGGPGDLGFEFKVMPDNHNFNQRRYEAIGEIITDEVYKLLETKGGLQKIYLHHEGDESHHLKTFVFASEDYLTNQDKLLVLIHGSGVVRAGQWARRLIINEDLDKGTQLPFIKQAIKEGYAVVVANSNDNHRIIGNKKKLIMGSENPVNHLLTMWEQLINKSPAKRVAIVAHSYGGVCTLELAKRIEDFNVRVFGVAMTDSVHYVDHHSIPPDLLAYLRKVGRNWVASGKALDHPVQTASDDLDRVSAGHIQHEMTSFCSMPSIFRFLRQKLDEAEAASAAAVAGAAGAAEDAAAEVAAAGAEQPQADKLIDEPLPSPERSNEL